MAPNTDWQSTLSFPGLVYVTVYEPGVAGQYSHVQCFATSFAISGTGWQVIIDRVIVTLTQSAPVRFGYLNATLTSLDGTSAKLDNIIAFTNRVEGRSQVSTTEITLAAVVGEVYVPAFTPVTLYGPFRFQQSNGLVLNPRTQGVGIQIVAWVTFGQYRTTW